MDLEEEVNMAFPITNFAAIGPQKSPMNNIIGQLLSGYTGGVNARYLPQEKEADIFAKRFTPLANLATTPMFLQNPQFQAALGQMLTKNLGFAGKEFQGMNLPTYGGQVQKDINEAEHIAPHLSQAGKAGVGASGLAGTAESYLGSIGKYITDFLTGGKITPKLAHEENRFNDLLQTFKNNAIQTQRVTPQQAEKIFKVNKNETPEVALKRIKKEAPYLFENQQSNPGVHAKKATKASSNPKSSEEKYPAPEGSVLLLKKGEEYYIPADEVENALREGFKYYE